MPNYKVRIEFNDPVTHGEEGSRIHAAELFIMAPSIMRAGGFALDCLADSFDVNVVKKIIEIESKPDALDAMCSNACGYLMSDVPPLKYACRSNHISFRNRTDI